MTAINFNVFDQIINGKMRPHLPAFDSEEKLRSLLADAEAIFVVKTEEDLFKMKQDGQFLNDADLEGLGFKEGDMIQFEITDEKHADGIIRGFVKNVSDENLEELINLNVAPPPNLKGEYFEFIIEREYKRQMTRIEYFFKECNDEHQLKFFANKIIQLLKKQAIQAHIFQKKLHREGIDDLENPDTYALYVLKQYIITALVEIQNLFEPFLSIPYQSEQDLKIELYEYSRTLAKIAEMNLRFKEKEIKNFQGATQFLNKALFQLEMYLTGKNEKIEFYNLLHGFSRFREELLKLENYHFYNTEKFCKYWCVLRDMKANVENKKYNLSIDYENKSYKKMIDDVFFLVNDLEKHLDKNEIPKVDKKPNTIFDITHPPDVLDAFETKTTSALVKVSKDRSENKSPISEYSFTFSLKGKSSLQKLNDLHDMLRKHKFISERTSVPQFKKIFSGEKVTKPIMWIGTPTDLHYFIILVHNKYKIVEAVKPSHWRVACKCFVNAKMENFVPNKLKDLKLPNKQDRERLDNILSGITPHSDSLS